MKFFKIAMGIVAVLIAIGAVVQQVGTSKANAKIDEANAAVAKADGHTQAAAKKYDELFTEENIGAFPGNREQLRKLAEEIAEHAKQGAKHFGDASAKFAEASQQNVGEKTVNEYWKIKSQVNQKLLEGIVALGEGAAHFLDESITEAAALREKVLGCTERLTKSFEEGTALNADAEKLHTDNKDKFKET